MKERINMDQKRFRVKQINIAAFLYSSGLQLVGTTRTSGEVHFEFIPKDKAEKLVKTYFADDASVNPRELFARLNDLRDLIFSGGDK